MHFLIIPTGGSGLGYDGPNESYDYPLWDFQLASPSDGANPVGGLTYVNETPHRILYGTTAGGGNGTPSQVGTIFSLTEITPPTMLARINGFSSVEIDSDDTTQVYTLQGASTPTGPWTNVVPAFTSYVAPLQNLSFYRLVAFITNAPLVVTLPATGVSANDATLNGTVVPEAPYATVWIHWGLDTNYTNGSSPFSTIGANSTNPIPLSYPISGLTPGATYHYQVVGTNNAGISYGNDESFTASNNASAPVATTAGVINVTPTSATLTGTVNPDGANTHAYFVYGTTTSYGSQTSSVLIDGTNTVAIGVSSGVAMFQPGTTYYYELVAYNSYGTNYGAEMDFATSNSVASDEPPTAVTLEPDPIQPTRAAFGGDVTPNNLDTTCWFAYGTNSSYGQTTASFVIPGSEMGPVSTGTGFIGPMTPSTIYHCQLFVSNALGTASGGDVSFTTAPEPPDAIVQTLGASSITSASAQLNGSVNPNGSVLVGFFQWGTTQSFGSNTPNFYDTSQNFNVVDESYTLTGLTPNTTYYYTIAAYNGGPDEVVGNTVQFTTSSSVSQLPPPVVATQAASSVGSDSATLNATVNPEGSSTMAYFTFGPNEAGAMEPTATNFVGSDSSAHSVSIPVTGLSPNTTYYFAVIAGNSGGSSQGSTLSFTTGAGPQAPPSVQTEAPLSVGTYAATIWGEANPNGADTQAYLEYSTNMNFASALQTPWADLGSGTTFVNLAPGIASLTPNTTYYYRIVATNSGGPNYAATVNFTTLSVPPPAPYVNTLTSGAISSNSANFNAFVNPEGSATYAFFYYGQTASYGSQTPYIYCGSSSNQQLVQTNISGLSPGTTYHYKAAAYNDNGQNVSYGLDTSFITLPPLPSVTTEAASGIDENGHATLNALVNPNGAGTDVSFQYGTMSNNLGSPTSWVLIGSGTSTVSASSALSGLPSFTEYYFRAVATNAGGTAYGAVQSFNSGGIQ